MVKPKREALIDEVHKQLTGAVPFRGQSADVCLLTRHAYEKLKAVAIPSPDEKISDRLYGIPLEVFDSVEAIRNRAVQLQKAGKTILMVTDALDA